ncbi:MAG: EI24 domain-containing protein [Candidatus Sumerlaeota bacterium]|nr:EI24 domain-containing protein [Candidatus Sumerlaeota bacterium]
MIHQAQHSCSSAATIWSAFSEGFSAPARGFTYMCRHPRLWTHAIIPILLNIVITGLALLLLIAAAGYFSTHLHPWFAGAWYWRVAEVFCVLAFGLMALAGACAVWLLFQTILCGYYYDKLARRIEMQLGLPLEAFKDISLWQQAAEGLTDVAFLIAGNAGLLFLNLIPVLGSAVAFVGSFYFSCSLFGAEYLSYPLSLRGIKRKERRAFARRFRFHVLGLGAVVFFFSLLPVIGSIILASAVAGAVLMHRSLCANARI